MSENATRQPLPDTAFYRAMAAGHLNRTGHVLQAVLVTAPAPADLVTIERTCCA